MAVRRIRQLGDEVLWSRSLPVKDPTAPRVRDLARDLRDTLLAFRQEHGYGRGIAAPQVGVLERVIVVDAPALGLSSVLVNPVILRQGVRDVRVWDSCFSLPGLVVEVLRSADIAVEYQDGDGATRTLEATGDLSELLQHEIDHLDGVLMLDRAATPHSVWSREEWERQRPPTAPPPGAPDPTGRNRTSSDGRPQAPLHTPEALADLHRRAHQSFSALLSHCRALTVEEADREIAGFGYPTVRLQLHHAIGAERYWVGVLQGRIEADDDSPAYPTIESLECCRERVFAQTEAYLRAASTRELNTACTMMTWGNRERMLTPAPVLMRTLTHLYHHQGQIVAMCRLLGKPVAGVDYPIS